MNDRTTFQAQIEENRETAGLLLAVHTLHYALIDPRLSARHRGVIAALCHFFDPQTLYSRASAVAISAHCGHSPTTVEKVLKELRAFGYVISERRTDAEGVAFTAHTLAMVKRAEAQAAISAYVEGLRARREAIQTVSKGRPPASSGKPSRGTPYFPAGEPRSSGSGNPVVPQLGEPRSSPGNPVVPVPGGNTGFPLGEPRSSRPGNPVVPETACPSSLIEKGSKRREEHRRRNERADLFDDAPVSIEGVTFPSALASVYTKHRETIGAKAMLDALKAAIARDVHPRAIEADLRGAVAAAAQAAGDREPAPSAIFKTATTYLNNANNKRLDRLIEAMPSVARPSGSGWSPQPIDDLPDFLR
ncbi:MAG: hypothetical protein AB7O57_02925 [Hyphomicrobiaceae bacterium]